MREERIIGVQLHYCMESTGLMGALGVFENLEKALGKAYLDAQRYIDAEQAADDAYYLTSLYYLEGGEDMAFNLKKRHFDSEEKSMDDTIELTYCFLMLRGEIKEV